MQTRRIGSTTVSAIGLGGMPMSIEGRPDDRSRSIATIHAALDAGITFIDTADAYHLDGTDIGHNETLIAEALAAYGGDTSDVLVATKGGHTRPGDGSWDLDGSPEHLRAACDASLKRLGVEAIGLYQFHRPDPKVPYAESIGGIRDLLDEGKIRMAGISNADPEQIRLANEILGGRLVSVQNQFSPAFRSSEPELTLCGELGIAFLPWSPLGGISKAERARVAARGVPGGRGRPRRQPPAGDAGLDARQGAARHPDPRVEPPGDDPRLRRAPSTSAQRRTSWLALDRRPERSLTRPGRAGAAWSALDASSRPAAAARRPWRAGWPGAAAAAAPPPRPAARPAAPRPPGGSAAASGARTRPR